MSYIWHRKPLVASLALVILISLVIGPSLAFLPEETLVVSLSILLVLLALVSGHLYDLFFYACPLVFLFAQFQIAAFDLARWVFLIFVILLSAYLNQKRRLAPNPVALGIGLIAVYAILTSPLSYYPTVSLQKGISLLLLAGFILFVSPIIRLLHPQTNASKYMLRMYLYFSIAIVVFNGIYYLVRPFSSNDFFSGSALLGGRFRGWFVNPNGIGAVYGIFLLPILWSEVSNHKTGLARLGLLFAFLLAAIQLLASQSRAGISAGTISLLVLVLGPKKWPSRMIIVTMLVLIVLTVYLDNPTDNLIRSFVYRDEVRFEGSGRLPVWVAVWGKFLANPVFGSGLGVADTGSDMRSLALNSLAYTIEKGNSYLGALEELGLVGVTLLTAALLLPILKACWKELNAVNRTRDKSNLVLAAIVVAGLANAMFEAWLLSVGSFLGLSFWMFASLLLYAESDI
jgi:O-antigen ligase